ncbi:MAG: glycosyltransferase family 2 protein [Desulfomicrobium sp.]|nr:glycosyltransferase family 2 protein [Desulfomicrobium sp.]NLV95901.1 glycosyltransferase family 2 protein [Desulfovibrionales bacterium]
MAPYNIAVIIPVYNQWELTSQCLHSLFEHTPKKNIQIIVVDNASTDATPKTCPFLGEQLFAQNFTYIRLETNINFGPGCNLGARHAQADFLFFLNNDTLLTSNWLPPLLQAFDLHPNLGAVGPLLLYPNNHRVQHLGVTFTPTKQVAHLYHQFPCTHRVVTQYRELQAITGAALLLPKIFFESIGGFWPDYRNGYEDLDLCAQIRSLGKTLLCEPTSRIYHLTSQTAGRFDSEDHNAQILSKRCHNSFYPDQHIWAAKDGYHLRLGHDLIAHIVYIHPDHDNVACDLEQLRLKIMAEPLWEAGYHRLVHEFCQRQMWTEALDILLIQQYFFPSEAVILKILKIATKTRNKNLVTQYSTILTKIRQADMARGLQQKFWSMRQWAMDNDDSILLTACDQWATKYFKGKS